MGLTDLLGKAYNVATDVAQAIGSTQPAVDAAHLAMDLVAHPWSDDDQLHGLLSDLGGVFKQEAGRVIGPEVGLTKDFLGGLGEVGKAADVGYRYGISRPFATAALYQGNNPFDAGQYRAAWNRSAHISGGQAIDWQLENQFSRAGHAVGIDPADVIGTVPIFGDDIAEHMRTVAADNFDIMDPEQRKAAFNHGFGRLSSGSIDAVGRWFLDPTVVAGHAAAITRAKVVTKPITAATDVTKELGSGRITAFLHDIHKPGSTPATRMDELMRNPAIKTADDGAAIAYLLAHSQDIDQARKVLQYGIRADVGSRTRLVLDSADLANQADHIRDVRLPMLQKVLDGETNPFWAQRNSRLLATVNDQMRAADQGSVLALMQARAEGSLRQVPRVTDTAAASGWASFQPSPYNVPLRIAKAATTKRPGVVDLSRPDGDIGVLQSFLDAVPGMTSDTRGVLLSHYATATDEASRQAAIAVAQTQAMRIVAHSHGLSPRAADAITAAHATKRDGLLGQVSDRAYSGATDAMGRYVDIVDVDGTATRLPLDVPQLANHVPLMDIGAHERVLRRNAALIAADEGGFVNAMRGVPAGKGMQLAATAANEAASAFQRYWKPAQLMRLGWPMRVVADEQLRMASVLGTLSTMRVVGSALRRQTPVAASAVAGKLTGRTMRTAGAAERIGRQIERVDAQLIDADEATTTALKAKRAELTARQAEVSAAAPEDAVSRFGLGTITHNGHTLEDAFGTEAPNIYKTLASSRPAWARLSQDSSQRLNDMRIARQKDWINLTPVPPAGADAATHVASYDAAWEQAVNDQIRSSPLARKILEGATDDDLLRWLRSPEGKAYGSRIALRAHDPHTWVGELRTHVEHYLPTPELRAAAAQGPVTAADLAAAVPARLDRPLIHGESLGAATGRSVVGTKVQGAIERMYSALGAAPTDVLSRQPFFAATYRTEVKRLVDRYDGQHIAGSDLRKLENRAREHSLRQVRSLLYELGNESDLSHLLRFVFPFYNAWQEVITRWVGLSLDDPSRLAHGMQLWNAPNDAGIVVDDEGNPVGAHSDVPASKQNLVAPLPKFLTNHIPGAKDLSRMLIPKDSLNLVLSGPNPWQPGAGPIVQVPIAHFVRDKPTLADSLSLVLPYGPGKNSLDLMLPAAGRRAMSAVEEDRSYTNAKVRVALQLKSERDRGLNQMDDVALAAEADRRTRAFWKLRTVSNLVLPFSPQYQSPYQPYIDTARSYQQTYAAYPDGKDQQGRDWQSAYLDRFGPDYFAFTESLSKSLDSVAPTVNGYRATKKFGDLLARHPDQGSLIVGDSDSGAFDPNVYAWQFGHQLSPGSSDTSREPKDVGTAITDASVRAGWVQWQRISDAIDTALFARGLRSINSAGARDLRNAKSALRAKLGADNPAWAADADVLDTGKVTRFIADVSGYADDSRFDNRPGWGSLRQYLNARQVFVAALRDRGRAGGSANLTAGTNADLATAWDAYAAQLRSRDTAFSPIYSRYLSNDNLES